MSPPDSATAAPELSVIFVNWNSTGYLRDCLASLLRHTRVRYELIVVDNASPVQDVGILTEEFPGVTLIRSAVNRGFAGANNLGFRHSRGEFLLFLNPDTELISPAIDQLLHAARSLPDGGIFGCRLLNTDGSVQTSCIQTFPTILNQALDTDFLRARWPRSPLWGTAPLLAPTLAPVRVEVVSGACMLVRRSVFLAAGQFSEDYFMYAEDLDLCRQVAAAGFPNYFLGQTELVHHGGKSSGSAPRAAIVNKWRSMVTYFARNYGNGHATRFRAVMAFVALTRLALLAPATLTPGKARAASTAAFRKWRTILVTLLSPSPNEQPRPRTSSGVRAEL